MKKFNIMVYEHGPYEIEAKDVDEAEHIAFERYYAELDAKRDAKKDADIELASRFLGENVIPFPKKNRTRRSTS